MWLAVVSWVGLLVVIMAYSAAAVSDVLTREVPDRLWAVAGAAGIAMSAAAVSDNGVPAMMLTVSAGVCMMSYLLSERVSGLPGAMVLASSALLYSARLQWIGATAFVTPAMCLAFVAMYHAGMLRGGADAKAMAVVAVAMPCCPGLDGVQLLWRSQDAAAVLLNPPMAVLALALTMSLLPALGIFLLNLRRGDIRRGMMSSYRMRIEDAERSFVWPLEHDSSGIPDDPDAVYAYLRRSGADEVRVTPMVPFVLPIAVALVTVVVLGNPLSALVP